MNYSDGVQMNKIYPHKEILLQRQLKLKANISYLYQEKDKLSRIITLLETENMIVEQLLKLDKDIMDEIVLPPTAIHY